MNDKHCVGCGVKLQDENMLLDGYTTSIENDICTRCFRLKNYGEFQIVTRSNEEYIEILKSVNETKDLVLYIVDLLNIENDINIIREYINNKILLVVNKRDVLPRSIKDEKIKEFFEATGLKYHDIIITSFHKNYNVDELYMMIKKYKSSKNVYIVGRTNVGKSTLVNTLIKNYSDNEASLTISALPSTTLNKISVKLSDDLTLVDTPGLIDRGNIINYVNEAMYKNIMPKKEIKPKTFQIKSGQCLVIDDLFRIDYVEGEKNSFTVFVSNNLKVKRRNAKKNETLRELAVSNYEVGYHQDIVVNGLGFIKIVEKAKVAVHIDRNVEVFVRDSLI